MIHGYDVSEFQGQIDFDQVKTDFLVIRDVYSTTHIDAQFARNLAQARQRNILHWTYSFVEPAITDPVSAVNYTMAARDRWLPGEAQVIDVERDTGPSLVAWTLSWMQTFMHVTGFIPIMYTNRYLLGKYDWSPVIALNAGLWLAVGDGRADDFSFDLHGWSVLAMKQYTLDGPPAPGIATHLDYDTFNGDQLAFAKYGPDGHVIVPPSPPLPVPPPPPVASGYAYTIVAGDTLSGIASRCGIGWRDLWNYDGNQAIVANPDLIYPGQVIRTPCALDAPPTPGPQECWDEVQSGDTLSGIAANHGMTWIDLWNFADNRSRIADPNLIYPGQRIRIPC